MTAHRTSRKRGKMVNGFDPAMADQLPAVTRERVARRGAVLGPAYRLFYAEPASFVRAKGALMYDEDGRDYLDAYNNVVSVGHCHPKVVAAVHEQMQTLCTHTRYLHDGILAYADRLLATFEDPLGHLMMTCTGSEANDLALRIAKYHTGNRGIIVTSEAYHGNSELTSGFSPSLGENTPLGAFVRRVPAPSTYRVSADDMGAWLAEEVTQQIHDLKRRGEGLAAFVADSLFTSDGIFPQASDIFTPVAEVVQAAGGLMIADEVQSGFARSGTHFWGYQRHGLGPDQGFVPDMVTLGKPMGNGYPVAGVMMRPDVVADFGHDMRYFNTFGGNTVAVAAAAATLSVIEDEGLLSNAERVGARLKAGIEELATRHALIGDVRGAGLYLGVELVSDREAKTPDARAALVVVNAMRRRRVLLSATSYHANVLKIRPPLVFSNDDADRFLTELDGALGEVA